MKKFFIYLFLLIGLLIGGLYLTGYGYLLKAVATIYGTGHSTTFLDDYTHFDNRVIEKSPAPQPWA